MNSSFIRTAITCILFLGAIPETSLANDPAQNTPWPVGFNTTEMEEISRTLMHSYGDLNGGWSLSVFHAGIDIHESTGSPPCNEVRCVDNGYATVVDEIPTKGSDGATQWVVIICDGIEGSVQNGWSYGHLTQPTFTLNQSVAYGQLIGTMINLITFPHVHFMWTDWDNNDFSHCNPLKYLSPSPTFEDNYDWTFNPENNDPSFEHFFLENMSYSAWQSLTVVETKNLMLDRTSLSGNVDFFFGVSLRGDGNPGGTGAGNIALAPQKISWNVVRETLSGEQVIDSRHVFDFDCVLYSRDTPNPDLRAKMLYFRYPMISLFNNNDALSFCLTNCDIATEWDGINTINESCWNTKGMASSTLDTENPVLAKYPDGSYRLDVLCYSFDEDYTFPASVDGVELHNYYPALKEVLVVNSFTDDAYYHAIWEPNTTGLLAELNVISNQSIPAGTELNIILVFSEEMHTGTGSVSASLGTSTISNGVWTSSTVFNDTWTGEVTMPSDVTNLTYLLSIDATDIDNNSLMNPQGIGSVPSSPTPDTHHSLSLTFGITMEWTATIHAPIYSSPKLADIEGDGDLDIVIQSRDGYVDVLNDNGISMGGNWPADGNWPVNDPFHYVFASPAIADLSGSSDPEIIAVHPTGCNGYTSTGQAISTWYGIINSDQYKWFTTSSPVTGNFTGDFFNEFIMGRNYFQGSLATTMLFARHSNGNAIWGNPIGIEEESIRGTTCLADVDNDTDLEIVVSTHYGQYPNSGGTDEAGMIYCFDAATGNLEWEYNTGHFNIEGALAVGNLDSDGFLEIIVTIADAGSSGAQVIDGNTGNIESWGNLSTGSQIYGGASIADIDSDGIGDIVLSCYDGLLYCWEGGTGNSLTGFPVDISTNSKTGVSIGDIDSDGSLELVVAGTDGNLYALNHDGSVTAGFPISVSSNQLTGQPAIGDIDNDGKLEILFGDMGDSVIYCYEMGDNSATGFLPWPQFQQNSANTGFFNTDTSPPAAPTNLSGNGNLVGMIFTSNLSWDLSPNDPNHSTPSSPTDVISYRIYRKFPPRPLDLVAELPAGSTAYTDVITFTAFPYPSVVAYYARAWDGIYESSSTPVLKLITGSFEVISTLCPVQEIVHSADIAASSLHSSRLMQVTAPANLIGGGSL